MPFWNFKEVLLIKRKKNKRTINMHFSDEIDVIKSLPVVHETRVQSLEWEDP